MGLAIKEAMFCSRPVIGNDVGGIPEAIIHNETGLLIDASNPQEFSSSILGLIEDNKLLNTMGEAGYERAMELFSISVTNERYTKIFNYIIDIH